MQDIQAFIQTNSWVLFVASIWETIWKGLALWRAGKKSQKYWFMAILVVNTVGLLPILYLLLTRQKKSDL